ncbi:hypothetical protein C8R46DRAFT_940916 [Mycena filopes]|nr:hypothetical protein C8R46DRAFT_940916 [Mycena filopes]
MASSHPTHLPALDAFPDLEDINNAAEALCLVVTTFLDDALQPLDALYTNVEPCRLLLARHDDLYTSLKESHLSRSFVAVRNHDALRRQANSTAISELLFGFRPGLVKFIEEGGPETWCLPSGSAVLLEEDVKAHIASLRIPDVEGSPSMLLRDLGNFSEDDVLARRVDNIFVEGHHTFLVNTSGSGKTRLTFEGLCQHWGFYVVGVVDPSNNIGSGDLKQLLEVHISRRRTALFHPNALPPQSSLNVAENIEVTRQCLRRLLLCRLLVFSVFADHIHAIGVTAAHKKIWLLVQTLMRTFGQQYDIFYDLLLKLADTEDSYICDHIAYLVAKLRKLFGDDFHLFVVVDEAQAIFRYHNHAFREGDGTYYPVLREILDGLDAEFRRHEISFVATGTQIPKSGFDTSRNAGLHRWCSDTGAFDDENLHHAYVSPFLPPSYLETKAGDAFVWLIWAWCRGRYRFTDALLATLARDGFRSPHTLFAAYIEAGTDYRPQSNREFVRMEDAKEHADIRITAIDCKPLESPVYTSSACTLRDILLHYSITGRHLQPFPVAHIQLVDLAFGRFLDDDMSQIVVDEPIMLVVAARWFYKNPSVEPPRDSLLDILAFSPPATPHAFLASLVIYLTHALSKGHQLSKIFSFPHSAVPVWAKQKARVVKLYRVEESNQVRPIAVDFSSEVSEVLASTSKTSDDLISWLDPNSDSPPFCFPRLDGTNLICVLQLADGTFVRIVLRATATETILRDSALKEVLRNLNDDNLFRPEAQGSGVLDRILAAFHTLPPPLPKVHRLPILRVVASFPAPTHLKTATNKNTRGVASLNLGLFKTISAAIPASAIFEKTLDMVTSLGGKRKRSVELESVESPGETTSKRRRVLAPKRRSGRLRV